MSSGREWRRREMNFCHIYWFTKLTWPPFHPIYKEALWILSLVATTPSKPAVWPSLCCGRISQPHDPGGLHQARMLQLLSGLSLVWKVRPMSPGCGCYLLWGRSEPAPEGREHAVENRKDRTGSDDWSDPQPSPNNGCKRTWKQTQAREDLPPSWDEWVLLPGPNPLPQATSMGPAAY